MSPRCKTDVEEIQTESGIEKDKAIKKLLASTAKACGAWDTEQKS